jgi:hypothetical protein
MNRLLIILLLATIILSAFSSFSYTKSAISSSPRIESTGTVQHGDLKIERIIFDTSNQWSIQEIAELADVCMNHYEIAFRVPKIHALNSEIICLIYRNIRAVYSRTPDEYNLFAQNGWILRDNYGTPIESKIYGYTMVDLGNPNYQEWIANWIKNYIDTYGYDGVFLDNCLPSTEILWDASSNPARNPRTGQPYTSCDFKDAVISLVNKIKNTIGDKKIVGNGIFDGERFFDEKYYQNYCDLLTQSEIEGIESECWLMSLEDPKWKTESEWLNSIKFVTWLQQNFLKNNKMFIPVCYNAAPYDQEEPELPYGCTKEQYALYGFCSLLLAVGLKGHYVMNYAFYDSEYVDRLFEVKIGEPLGNYYKISGTHVYARDFTKSKILVNPTNFDYTVKIQNSYNTFEGQSISDVITLRPHTAEILLNK